MGKQTTAANPWAKQSVAEETATDAVIAPAEEPAPATSPAHEETAPVAETTGEPTQPLPAPKETAPAPVSAPATAASEGKVTVVSPKAFLLRIDNDKVLNIKAGVQELEAEYADHWYAKANGLTIYQPEG